MKSFRGYIFIAVVGVVTALSVACSKTASNGGAQACPPGYTSQNGICGYNPYGGGGGGGTGTGATPGSGFYAYGKNGHIVNMSKFKDFNLRVNAPYNPYQSAYWCVGGRYIAGVYIDCDDAYLALIKNGTNYYVEIISSSLTNDYAQLYTVKFSGSTTTQSIFEIYETNPVYYKIAELVVNGDLATATSVSYSLNYSSNVATPVAMVTGTMYKGYDY
jgi:hypothetical protein